MQVSGRGGRLDQALPNPHNEESEIEIRQLFELEDFGASEAAEHHSRLSDRLGKK
jgi:hypothetical protein